MKSRFFIVMLFVFMMLAACGSKDSETNTNDEVQQDEVVVETEEEPEIEIVTLSEADDFELYYGYYGIEIRGIKNWERKIEIWTETSETEMLEIIIPSEIDELPVIRVALNMIEYAQCKSIYIPDSVTSLSLCGVNVEELRLPETEYLVEEHGFASVTTESIVLSDKVTLSESAFEYCDIKYVEVPTLTEALFANSNVEEVVVTGEAETVPEECFVHCVDLKNVVLPNTVKQIEIEAFLGCVSLESIDIPEGVTAIRAFAFQGCSSLEKVILPETCIIIEKEAFAECYNLKSIDFTNITQVGRCAFWMCNSLEVVEFSEKIHLLAPLAFGSCPNLKTIYIPATENLLIVDDAYGGLVIPKYGTVIATPAGSTADEYARTHNLPVNHNYQVQNHSVSE